MKNILSEKPKELREGQTVFVFLEWLSKMGYDTEQSHRMADPFHISDKELKKLYKKFLQDIVKYTPKQ